MSDSKNHPQTQTRWKITMSSGEVSFVRAISRNPSSDGGFVFVGEDGSLVLNLPKGSFTSCEPA